MNVTFSGAHNMDIIATYVENLNATFQPSSFRNRIYAEYAKNISIQTYGRFANGGSFGEAANLFANFSENLNYSCYSSYSEWKEGIREGTNTSCNGIGIYRTPETVNKTRLKCEAFGCGNMTINTTNGLKDDYIIDYNGCGKCESLEDCFKREWIKWNVSCYDKKNKKMMQGVFDGKICSGDSQCCGGIVESDVFRNEEDECLDLSTADISNVFVIADVVDAFKFVRSGIIGKRRMDGMRMDGMSVWAQAAVMVLAFGAIGIFFMMIGVYFGYEIQIRRKQKIQRMKEKFADK